MDAAFRTNTTKNNTMDTVNSVASPPETTERRPGDVAASPGVFSHTVTDTATKNSPIRRQRASTMKMVRADYHKHPVISYAEAALIAGVSVITICNWVYKRILPVVAKRGPYRIDVIVLRKVLKKEPV